MLVFLNLLVNISQFNFKDLLQGVSFDMTGKFFIEVYQTLLVISLGDL